MKRNHLIINLIINQRKVIIINTSGLTKILGNLLTIIAYPNNIFLLVSYFLQINFSFNIIFMVIIKYNFSQCKKN